MQANDNFKKNVLANYIQMVVFNCEDKLIWWRAYEVFR